jgi:hypothetical protein
MKKWINIAKSGSILLRAAVVVVLLVASSCSQSENKDYEGTFTGSDGSSQTPSQVQWQLAVAGDGLVSGIWSSKGEISKGQLSAKLSTFGNELTLFVQSGVCTGQFRGTLAFTKDQLKGTLKDNPNCPDRSYNFSLQKSH